MQIEEGFFGSGQIVEWFFIASEPKESGQEGFGTCSWFALGVVTSGFVG